MASPRLFPRVLIATVRTAIITLVLTGFAAAAQQPSPGKVPMDRDFGEIQREVETLRGKKFIRPVPVYKISAEVLQAISDHDLEKEYPGAKLHNYEELLAWLDFVPPGTDLKAAEAAFSVNEVAGLYDSDAKEMCIPSSTAQLTNATPAEKKAAKISLVSDDIVLAHEFTHALEDQYWPIDDPKDDETSVSTDRGAAHDFLLEGSATREMVEVVPAQWSQSPNGYFFLWNLIHSDAGEFILDRVFKSSWKSPDILTAGVPETLARTESMPYSYGYCFCAHEMRQWGLDGLDHFYRRPLISSTQVMHPKKAWEWRDLPMQIDLPETLPGGWKQTSLDSMGEAGMAVFFGCHLNNLSRGLQLARGWKGDHTALFAGPQDRRLLLWASAWNSAYAAGVFARACAAERQGVDHAAITQDSGNRIDWARPDGRFGFVVRRGKTVLLCESDETLQDPAMLLRAVHFTEPPETAARAAVNSPFRRFNPLLSWQKDDQYIVIRSLGGLLSRHDQNTVGAANQYLLGLLAESRRTASFAKWEVGGCLLARHEAEARRGITRTTLLPWGVLASYSSARLPQSPEKVISRTSVLWGLAASMTKDGAGQRSDCLLPFGLLWRHTAGPGDSSTHVLGTGVSRTATHHGTRVLKRYRLLGIPLGAASSKPVS